MTIEFLFHSFGVVQSCEVRISRPTRRRQIAAEADGIVSVVSERPRNVVQCLGSDFAVGRWEWRRRWPRCDPFRVGVRPRAASGAADSVHVAPRRRLLRLPTSLPPVRLSLRLRVAAARPLAGRRSVRLLRKQPQLAADRQYGPRRQRTGTLPRGEHKQTRQISRGSSVEHRCLRRPILRLPIAVRCLGRRPGRDHPAQVTGPRRRPGIRTPGRAHLSLPGIAQHRIERDLAQGGPRHGPLPGRLPASLRRIRGPFGFRRKSHYPPVSDRIDTVRFRLWRPRFRRLPLQCQPGRLRQRSTDDTNHSHRLPERLLRRNEPHLMAARIQRKRFNGNFRFFF